MENRTFLVIRLTFGYVIITRFSLIFAYRKFFALFLGRCFLCVIILALRRIIAQVWCSFITFPLYVIITQATQDISLSLSLVSIFLSPLTSLTPVGYIAADGFKVQEIYNIRKREEISSRLAKEGTVQTWWWAPFYPLNHINHFLGLDG